jgi:hypothetical protein
VVIVQDVYPAVPNPYILLTIVPGDPWMVFNVDFKIHFLLHPFGGKISFFFLVGLGFDLRALHSQSTCSIPLESHLQFVLLWLFWRWGSCELTLNVDLLHLSLSSSYN